MNHRERRSPERYGNPIRWDIPAGGTLRTPRQPPRPLNFIQPEDNNAAREKPSTPESQHVVVNPSSSQQQENSNNTFTLQRNMSNIQPLERAKSLKSVRSHQSKAVSVRSLQLRNEMEKKGDEIDDELEQIEQQQLELKKKRLLEKKKKIQEEYEREIALAEQDDSDSSLSFVSAEKQEKRVESWIKELPAENNPLAGLRATKSFNGCRNIEMNDSNDVNVSHYMSNRLIQPNHSDDARNNSHAAIYEATQNVNKGPGNFTSGPSNFTSDPRDFNRNPPTFDNGPHNFVSGARNFDSGPRNFNSGAQNFNNGPTNLNRGLEDNNVTNNDVLLAAFNALKQTKTKDLPIFNGDQILEFPNFMAEFERSTEEMRITNRENLRRLNKAVQGNARKTIQSLLYDENNVQKIIQTLQMNFGRKEWIIVKLMNKLKSFPNIKEESLESFRNFHNEIFGAINAIKNMKASRYLESPELLWCLEEKLPMITRGFWNHHKADLIRRGRDVGVDDFADWFTVELDAQFAGLPMKELLKKSETRENKKSGNVFHVDGTQRNGENRRIWCVFCNNKTDHNITKCKKFYAAKVDDRRKFVLEKRLCFACLRKGHGTDKCTEKEKYKCTKCQKYHNDLVHPESDEQPVGCISTREALLKIARVFVKGKNGVVRTVYAFFDDGATISLMEESLAKELGLSGEKSSITYKWVKDIVRTEHNSQTVQLEISQPFDNAKTYDLVGVRTVKGLSLPKQELNVDEIIKAHPYVERKLLEDVSNVQPLILIGTNNAGLTVPLKTIQHKVNGLQVCKSRLGWTVHGSTNSEASSEGFTMAIEIVSEEKEGRNDRELTHLMTKSYELEKFGLTDEDETLSEEDARAVEIMKSSLKRVNDRFEIGHLYRYSNIKFPTQESKNMALRRLSFIERKMDSDEAFAKAYIDKIDDYLQKGYASQLSESEKADTANTFYLPHFGVYNPNKPGKFRMVMDAKAKAGNFSLNDLLLKGPDFVPSLLAILWRGRLYPYIVSADIKEMFHQVLIRQEDRNSQRFLFRGMRREGEPDVYVMNAMIFGAVSSPSVAQFVKNENAKLLESELPGIQRAIEKQHYVDDYFDSFPSEQEAIEMVGNVIQAHKRGGFELVKWISNSKAVMESIDTELLLPDHDKQDVIRILGLMLNLKTDNFEFNLDFAKLDGKVLSGETVPTKRQLLCFMMGIFDPIGFLAPLVIKLKIIFQELWRQNLKWDQKIPDVNFEQWKSWLCEAKKLKCISIPRCYLPVSSSYENATLHVFCDASDKAYSVVIYLRIEDKDKVYTSFVHSKARVAPLKSMTIPRLELQGAVTGSLLTDVICKELNIQIQKRYLWSDSKVVLSWINTKEKLAAYVGNRVEKILAVTDKEEWRWIPSNFNSADLATKLSNKIDLSSKSKWFSGPEFLSLPESDWPSFETPPLDEQEVCMFTEELHRKSHSVSVNTISTDVLNAHRFSDYNRLIRSTAFVLKMIKTLKQKKQGRPEKLFIDLNDIHGAKEIWYKKVQSDSYEDEMRQLLASKFVSESSKLYQLSPFIDDNGTIRMKGRIPGYNPIILDPNHHFTFLLVHWYHEVNLHSGIESVINQLREMYWIPKCRSLVKKVFKRCNHCKILKPKVKPVIMGDIPKERSEPCNYSFTFVGLDYFGPMMVKYGRKREKIWGALFTCMTTRAIHVELVSKLDTNCALMAITRFANLRGVPKKIFSDNATCFKSVSKELEKLRDELDDDQTRDKLSLKNIQWMFNPPAAPNFGGVYERMVRSVKEGLRVLLTSECPSYEVLSTAISEVINTVNNRPLTFVSGNQNDIRAITPNDIVLLRVNNSQLDAEVELNYNPRQTWKNAHELADQFWKMWVKSYRPLLLKRMKWPDNRTDPELKIGDFVYIIDENEIRGRYLKGIIVKVYPDKNNRVRVADIKTNTGILKRSVQKIAKIDICGGPENVTD